MQNQKGFTLIELMIVIAIIAILAAIALPAYNNYTARSQVSEAVSLAASFKTPVGLFVTEEGVCPTKSDEGFTGLEGTPDSVGQYVQSIDFSSDSGKCIITANMASTANAKVKTGNIVLTSSVIAVSSTSNDPAESTTTSSGNGIAKWSCTSTISDEFLPKSCKI